MNSPQKKLTQKKGGINHLLGAMDDYMAMQRVGGILDYAIFLCVEVRG